MARTKGAKNKKTLAKEAGMSLEQYEQALASGLNPFSFSEPKLPGQIEIKLEDKSEDNSEDELNLKTLVSRPDLKVEPIIISFLESEPKELNSEELELQDSDSQNFQEDLKKIKNTKENSLILISTKKRKPSAVLCDRCGSEIKDSPKKINLTYLTGLAPWRRDLNKDIINLCSDCALKMSGLVEEFLWDNGEGIGLKFNQTELNNKIDSE